MTAAMIDDATFEALWERHHGQIYAYARRLLGELGDGHIQPEDIVQETFMGAARTWHRFDGSNVVAWLHRIARNECLDHLRRNQRLHFAPWDPARHDQLQVAPEDAEAATIRAETVAAVRSTLDRVSARHRRALILYEWDGLGCEEIAERMAISRSSVKSLLHRARLEFGRIWREREGRHVAA